MELYCPRWELIAHETSRAQRFHDGSGSKGFQYNNTYILGKPIKLSYNNQPKNSAGNRNIPEVPEKSGLKIIDRIIRMFLKRDRPTYSFFSYS